MEFSKKCLIGLNLTVMACAAHAQVKGPDPTNASIQAAGPFAVSTVTVRGNGFGGATVYVPNAAGTYALVAFCPGFTARQSSVQVLGQRLATHGFVVATIDTNSTFDFPESRGTQLLAALRTVGALNTGTTIARGKIDTARRVVTGHSMGGGGSLFASRTDPTIRASVPLTAFSSNVKSFNTTVPAFIIGGEVDNVAPVGTHSIPFFNGLPNATPKVYAQVNDGDHFFPTANAPNQPTSKFQIAWIKRFADGDARYTQFVNTAGVSTELNAGRLSDVRIEAF